MQSPYLADILLSSRRVLTLMNRNPFDSTSGSFDRGHWHFKTSDFTSATFQMGVGILAKLWALEGSEYFKNKTLLDWIELGISHLERIQHSDGSFDEWYVNERGWAGPTGYIMNACLDCYELVGLEISSDAKNTLEKVINRGVDFLKYSNEGHMIANHVAIVYLPLVQAMHLLKRTDLDERVNELKDVLVESWNEDEGWSLEYDGADPGYQSGTMSFLAKTLKYDDRPEIRNICERSLDFISYFAFPSGAVGGALGSRHTVTFFCAGIEALKSVPLGARLSSYVRDGLLSGNQVLSSDLDDHYLIYRLYEFLDAHFYWSSVKASEEGELPFEKGMNASFEKTFNSANLFIKANKDYYIGMALNKGGAIRIERPSDGEILLVDGGVLAKKDGKVFSSLACAETQWKVESESVRVQGQLVDVTSKEFSPLKFILFRLFMMIFGLNHNVAQKLKKAIKSILIFHTKRGDHFSRMVSFDGGKVVVETRVQATQSYEAVQVGGEFWTRYVPQSRHYLGEHLKFSVPYFSKNSVSGEIQAFVEVGG